MISTNKSSVSNLKFEEITKCAIEDWELPTLNHPKLEYVMNSFRVNVARVRHLLLLPTAVAGLTALTRRIHDIAEYEITGSLSRDELSLSPQIRSKINDLATGMLDAKREHAEAQQGT